MPGLHAEYDENGNIRICGNSQPEPDAASVQPTVEQQQTQEEAASSDALDIFGALKRVLDGTSYLYEPSQPEPLQEEPVNPATYEIPSHLRFEDESEEELAFYAEQEQDGALYEDLPASPLPMFAAQPTRPTPPAWTSIRKSAAQQIGGILREGKEQYDASVQDVLQQKQSFLSSLREATARFRSVALQPVWIPTKKKDKPMKQYSRAGLFTRDVVRFGGTFAALFVVLFSALNYQSFWEIAKARVNPFTVLGTQAEGTTLAEKLKHSPTLAVAGTSEDHSLLGMLPQVGPPGNYIVIPKLDLNVPIQIPSSEALMREDWDKLEEDIQHGLEKGVVHYPGTAKPGQAGNFFVTGHSSYYPWAAGDYKNVFATLHLLDVGDEFWIYYGGDQHRYRVVEEKEVYPSDVSVLEQPLSKRMATLMTCTPVGTTLRRLILHAEELHPETGEVLEVGEAIHHEPTQFTPQMLPI